MTEFYYLDIRLENRKTWVAQIAKSSVILKQKAGVILKFANSKQAHLMSPALEIWRAQAISAATYGAELWGHSYTNILTTIEHKEPF